MSAANDNHIARLRRDARTLHDMGFTLTAGHFARRANTLERERAEMGGRKADRDQHTSNQATVTRIRRTGIYKGGTL